MGPTVPVWRPWEERKISCACRELNHDSSAGRSLYRLKYFGSSLFSVAKTTLFLLGSHIWQRNPWNRNLIIYINIYNEVTYIYIYKYIKAVPLQAWSCPEGSRKSRLPDYMTTVQNGGKIVSLTHRPPFPQEMLLILISVRDWVDPRTLVRSEGFYISEKFQWHQLR